MKILQVLAPAEFGGLESVVVGLASGHHGRGHWVHVGLIDRGGGTADRYASVLGQGGVAHTVVRVNPRQYFGERRVVTQLCRDLKPDVAHFHGYRCDVLGGPAARVLGIPTVSTAHGFAHGGRGFKNDIYEYLQRRALRQFEAVIGVSRPIVDQLVRGGVSPRRVHLVPNAWSPRTAPLDAVAARARLGVPEGRLHLGWVGRLTGEKGADILVRALPYLLDLPLTVSFVGEGPDRQALEPLARQLGVGERIRWHGAVEEAGRLFPAFDLFVISSRTEGTPIVLFEAMACGVPVVSTRVGGVPDVVSDQEAILVAADDPRALADGIRRAFNDAPAARARASRALVRLRADFDLDAWLARHENIYQQILVGRSVP